MSNKLKRCTKNEEILNGKLLFLCSEALEVTCTSYEQLNQEYKFYINHFSTSKEKLKKKISISNVPFGFRGWNHS